MSEYLGVQARCGKDVPVMGSESKLESVAHPLANKNTEQFRWPLSQFSVAACVVRRSGTKKEKNPTHKRLSSGQVCLYQTRQSAQAQAGTRSVAKFTKESL